MLDFYVKTRIRFSLRDKRLFEITEIEITRVDCSLSSRVGREVNDFNSDETEVVRSGNFAQ